MLCSALRDQCVIIRGVEQLLLSDSPVSGMVLATHEGAQQECNRPDQLRQCRYHCYSDLGFLLPIQTSPPPLTRTSALCQPSHLLSSVSTPRQECCWPGAMPWRHPIVAPPPLMSRRVRQRCHKLPFRGPLLRAPLGGDHTGWHERTNDCHPSHVRVDSCTNVQLTPTSAIP